MGSNWLGEEVLAAFFDPGGELGITLQPLPYLGGAIPQSFRVGLLLRDRETKKRGPKSGETPKRGRRVWAVRLEFTFVLGSDPLLTEVVVRGLHERLTKPGKPGLVFRPDLFNADQKGVELWQLRFVAENLTDLCRIAMALAAREARHFERPEAPGKYSWLCDQIEVGGLRESEQYKAFRWRARDLDELKRHVQVREVYEQEVLDARIEHRRAKTTEKVMEHFNVSRRQAETYISEARKAGKLPKTTRGKTSNFPTNARSNRGK